MSACLYVGSVIHRRLVPPAYRFRYRLFQLCLDVERIPACFSHLRWLSVNRFNLFSFHESDHGPRDGSPLRPWIDGVLRRAGLDLEGGTVRLLCMPRVLGYGFNPLSVWYCHHADGSLRAVLCEVRNTFGEWHGYLLHEQGRPMTGAVRSRAVKCFHVSPFFPVAGEYRFRLGPPAEHFSVTIEYQEGGKGRMLASQRGQRYALTDGRLLGLALGHPLQSLKVIAAIHWQGLMLWLRGARFHRKPAPPEREIS